MLLLLSALEALLPVVLDDGHLLLGPDGHSRGLAKAGGKCVPEHKERCSAGTEGWSYGKECRVKQLHTRQTLKRLLFTKLPWLIS